jgi:hypothetical protein
MDEWMRLSGGILLERRPESADLVEDDGIGKFCFFSGRHDSPTLIVGDPATVDGALLELNYEEECLPLLALKRWKL